MKHLPVEQHLTVDELLTVQELAQALKVKVSWVYSRTRQTGPEAMPRISLGKYRRFRLQDVLAWCEKKQS